jgi:probable phosphoglycerate mutase
VAETIGAAVAFDDDLREVAFGEQEGQPMGSWYGEWLAGRYTPNGGETFAALRTRATGAVNRALERPAPVLVVGHGALFRSLRSAMGLAPTVRTENASPLYCEPGTPWRLIPAVALAAE